MGRRKTHDEFMQQIITLNRIKDDYSKVKYLDLFSDIIIICLEHGEYKITPSEYIKYTYGCNHCRKDAINNNIIKKTKSTEKFISDAIKVHGDTYFYLKTIYINTNIDVIITCKEHGDFPQSPGNHINGAGCPDCGRIKTKEKSSFTNENIDQYLIGNNKKIKRLDKYENSHIIMNWQCLELKCNHIWPMSFKYMKAYDCGCPKCTKPNNESVDKFLLENDIKIKRLGNYIKSNIEIDWQCLICRNIWLCKPKNIMRAENRRSGCPDCSCRKNEKLVKNFLKENNINFEKIKIKLPINKRKTLPDFYFNEFNLIIEYQGIQHYRTTQFGTMTLKEATIAFEKQQIRDLQLREYCNQNNIQLWEIDGRKYTGNKLITYLNTRFKNIDDKMTYIHDCN